MLESPNSLALLPLLPRTSITAPLLLPRPALLHQPPPHQAAAAADVVVSLPGTVVRSTLHPAPRSPTMVTSGLTSGGLKATLPPVLNGLSGLMAAPAKYPLLDDEVFYSHLLLREI